MSTMLLTTRHQTSLRLPEFALVLGISVAGLFISLAFAVATWADGPIVG